MAKKRLLDPDEFFQDWQIGLSPLALLIHDRLRTIADREGRLEDGSARIGRQILPSFPVDQIGSGLQELNDTGVIARYSLDGAVYIQLLKYITKPLKNEAPSVIPGRLLSEKPISLHDSDKNFLSCRVPLQQDEKILSGNPSILTQPILSLGGETPERGREEIPEALPAGLLMIEAQLQELIPGGWYGTIWKANFQIKRIGADLVTWGKIFSGIRAMVDAGEDFQFWPVWKILEEEIWKRHLPKADKPKLRCAL